MIRIFILMVIMKMIMVMLLLMVNVIIVGILMMTMTKGVPIKEERNDVSNYLLTDRDPLLSKDDILGQLL